MQQILITGPVHSTSSDSASLYEVLVNAVKEFADSVYSPLDTMAFRGSPRERYERGMRLVRESDLLIADVSLPSTGQGMEIQEASRNGIPLIGIAPSGSKVSSMVEGCSALQNLVFYDSQEHLLTTIVDRLAKWQSCSPE